MPLSGYSTFVGDGLNRFSNTPFANLTRVRWNDCYGFVSNANDCLSSKGFSYARHEVAPGVTVDVYNLHADAGGESGDIDARALNFAQLAQFILATSADQALIVVGDTNLKASKRPRDGTVLQDFLGTTGLADVGATLPNIPEHLDRVLLRDGAKVKLRPLGWRVADEFVDPNGADLSDHEAIHVDVEWRTTP